MQKLDKQDIQGILALTPMQEGMLYHYLENPGSPYYFEQLSLEIEGEICLHLFEKAWDVVIKTNEMLRTVFRWEKMEHPVQIILDHYKLKPAYYDFSGETASEKKKQVQEIKDNDRKTPFDLRQVPFRLTLCKMGAGKYEMMISNYHILYDGWSNGIILKEFFEAYKALSGNVKEPAGLLGRPPKTGFKEFVKWMQNQDRNKQQCFWGEYLAGLETTTELPIKKRAEETTGVEAEGYSIILEEDLRGKLEVFARNKRVTLAAVFYTAWGILLQKYCDSGDVVFGTTVSGRSAGIKGIEDMVGLFINTLPLRVRSGPGVKITDVLTGIENLLQEREEFENTPLVDIRDYSALPGSGSLFDTMVAIENYPLGSRLIPQGSLLSVHSYSISEMTHYDLTVGIIPFNDIEIKFSFRRELFEKETIENLSCHFKGILGNIIGNPGAELSRLEIITSEEKKRVLYEFNDTAAEYPKGNSLHGLFAQQVERTPDNIAVIGKAQSAEHKAPCTMRHALTYRELNEKSAGLASTLIEKGVKPDTIVGIMIERSIEMIVGILGILKAGGAYLPIDPNYPQERIDYMLTDSNARILVSEVSEVSKVSEGTEIVSLSELSEEFPTHLTHLTHPTQLCYVIYTSGSTGKPKGVLVRHDGVTNTIYWRKNEYRLEKNDNVLQLFSFAFDGFVTSFFTPIISGSCVVFLPDKESSDIFAVKKAIVSIGITHFISVPSVYGSLLELCSPGDLPTLRIITLAGEAVDPVLLEKSRQLNPRLKVMIEYGPTESTVVATIYRDARPGPGVLIGKPVANTKIYILDRNGHLSPIGVSGEINILGIGTARGYLNNPGLTAEKFILAHSSWLIADRREKKDGSSRELPMSYQLSAMSCLYKTGDLGRWLPDGNIEFLGRMDHQVKIRGFRVELGEIESRLVGHEGVKHAVVIVKKDESGDAFLCAYVVPFRGKPVEIPGLRDYLRQKLPGYMVPAHFVMLEAMPVTPSGKIDRKSLPGPGKIPAKGLTAPQDDLERQLVEIWSGVLGVDKHMLGIDSNFFDSGGHSLKAARLLSRIHKTLNVRVPLAQMFKNPCIRGMASYIRTCSQAGANVIEKTEEKEYYPLSPAQKRLYILYQMDPGSTGYNVPYFALMEGDVKRSTWEDTIKKLIARHESLRTSFIVVGSEAVQQVHDEAVFDIEYYDLAPEAAGGRSLKAGEPEERKKIQNSFTRPFDLSCAPLLRLGLARLEKAKYLFMLDMHHIISDLFSHLVFIKDFINLYGGNTPAPSFLQYKDFCRWQSCEAQQKEMKKQEAYWLNIFNGSSPQLNMPIDYPRSRVYRFEGKRREFKLDESLAHRVRDFVEDSGITLNILFLAVYNLLLSKYTQQDDIVVGTPIFGRRHNDLYGIIGFFSNMLPIKTRISADQHFTHLMEAIKDNYFNAYENQDYPFDELVWKLGSERDPGRLSLVETVLVVVPREFEEIQRQAIRDLGKMGIKLTPCTFDLEVSHFDLMVHATECSNGIDAFIEYRTVLFKPSTIEGMAKHFIEVLEQVLEDKGRRLKEITITPFTLTAKANLLQDEQGDWELE
ncbi:MAG: amino acid adenylation domain-containing protein [Candidatus Aminicenantes bacterium]|nr:amino acid adenylation domain-containing protein [Candidatus Aminicenantes bacterium]NIM79679.1 amino acid adenylation domain-containing protein [Candidatus Aminicenantes bacterium]NIN19005.1 amino acid adenylation domain-containing protein [Candidatus Aminicenantes bacterium]NIN42907.1 amino acid adenylation domain-containing protein [Candidatus Aminicenantes bacterium]NIN85644.1 amino acid adenylation domain-containing protein [Candidatus Aminicenantes bacterium]